MSEQTKSNAPWILGIVGIVFTIIHMACAVLCTAAVGATKAVSGAIDVDLSGIDRAADPEAYQAALDAASKAAVNTMDNSITIMWVGIILLAICFILSFFGKSKFSKITGIIMVVGSIIATIVCCMHFSLMGLIAGILYLVAGCISITNFKKAAA